MPVANEIAGGRRIGSDRNYLSLCAMTGAHTQYHGLSAHSRREVAMRSPFPGMDPFLEESWRDVHSRLVMYAGDALQPHLPKGLKARVEERVFLEWPDSSSRPRYPDVRIFEDSRATQRDRGPAVLEPAVPLLVDFPIQEIEETQLQIIDALAGNRVVTCVEVLSPTNKEPGAGLASYQGKRDELLRGGASFVEIDLIRGGKYVLYRDPGMRDPSQRGTYHVCITRASRCFQQSEVYPIGLWERLPVIRIPLRESDDDALLDLQAVLEQAYERGLYEDIDYRQDLTPPLPPQDQARLDEILASRD